MASSPPSSIPHMPLANPKKRPSLGLHAITTQPEPKRQKVQPHPLRQSSYPDPASAAAVAFYQASRQQAPHSALSETGSVANSVVSGSVTSATTKSKRPRGRPRKSAQLNGEDALQASEPQNVGPPATERAGANNNNTDGKSQVSASRGGRGGTHDYNENEDDAEDDEEDLPEALPLNEQEKLRRKEEDERDHARERLLYEALSQEQAERYEVWKRVKLNKNVLRKIVNQTVSQSVTANPLLAVGMYSKHFVGEIIVKACEVQKEWAKARDVAVKKEKRERAERREGVESRLAELRRRNENASERFAQEDGTLPLPLDHRAMAFEINHLATELYRLREEEKRVPIANEHRGGLLPDHVREALRRYNAAGEGGGVGFAGLSNHLIGVSGSATWRIGQGLGARRLFK